MLVGINNSLNDIPSDYKIGENLNGIGCLKLAAYYVANMIRPKRANMNMKLCWGMIKERKRFLDYAYNPDAHSGVVNFFCDCVSDEFPYNTEERIKAAIIKSYEETWEFIPYTPRNKNAKIPHWKVKDPGYKYEGPKAIVV